MAIRATTITANTTLTERLIRIVTGALLLVPGILLAVFGFAQFRDGLARDAAIPVPVYMVAQIPIPKAAYVSAVDELSRADPRDGQAMIAAAEARLHAGEPAARLAIALTEGVMHQPASARGWTLLSEALYPSQKNAAARAFSQALALAPREFWLVGMRVKDASSMWASLNTETQAAALTQTRLLWQEPSLHGQLKQLLQTDEGRALVARAFGPEDVRSINRWYAREERRSSRR